jgi:putative flippase GtrA
MRLVRELSGYASATAVAFGVDFATLALLVSVCGVPYLLAAAVAFVVGTALMYWAATRHIFEFRRVTDPRKEFSVFLGIGAAGLAINLVVIYVAVEMFGLHYLVGKIGSGALTFVLNFVLRRLLLFTPWQKDPSSLSSQGIDPR